MITKKIKSIKLKELLDEKIYNTNVDIQRDYIYKNGDLSIKVIDSIMNNINIATITCWDNKDGTFDVIDGKQRTTTIRQFVDDNFPFNGIEFQHFHKKERNIFLETEIIICIHSGNFDEKVKCYTQINNGMSLTDFEKYYALFHGEYLKGMKNFSNDGNLVKIFGKYNRGANCIDMINLLTGNQNMNTHHEFLYEKRNDSFHDDMRKLSALFEWTLKIFEDYDLDLNELCYVLYKHWKNRIEWQKNSSIICEILDSHNINKDRKYRNCSFYVYYTELLNVWNKSDLDPKRFFTPEQKYEHWKDNHPENYPHEFEYYRDWEMDHKIPWSKGGKTIPNNAQLLKPTENKSKGSKW